MYVFLERLAQDVPFEVLSHNRGIASGLVLALPRLWPDPSPWVLLAD